MKEMLTEEEYIDIIDLLDFFYGDNLIATAELRKEKSKELQEEDLNNFKKKIDCLSQLIQEHFNNSLSFKAFKLPSYSTLKGIKKDELIDYIHILYENWRSADSFNESLSNYNRILTDELNKADDELCIIKELTNNTPLKFEDLKDEMWVWDNKFECYEKIHGIDKYLGIMFENGFYGEWFEENRFYLREVKEDVY